jgi:hypothetical protein
MKGINLKCWYCCMVDCKQLKVILRHTIKLSMYLSEQMFPLNYLMIYPGLMLRVEYVQLLWKAQKSCQFRVVMDENLTIHFFSSAYKFQENLLKTMLQIESTFFALGESCTRDCLIICDRGTMDASACMYLHSWIVGVQYAYAFINNYIIQPEVYIPEILHYCSNVCVCRLYMCVYMCMHMHVFAEPWDHTAEIWSVLLTH